MGILTAGEPANQRLHRRNPCRTTDQDHLVDIVGGDLGVTHRLLHRTEAAFHQIRRQILELRSHDRGGEVLGTVRVSSDEGQVDLRLRHRGQLDLGLLRGLEEALQCLRILAQIDVLGTLEFVGEVVHQAPVEVVAAEVGVAGRGPNLDYALTDVEQTHIERAAAQVEHQYGFMDLLVHAVRQCRRGRLVDDSQNFEASDAAGILGGVALRVIEIGRNGDDRFLHLLAKEPARVVDELAQHQCTDLLRRVLFAPHVESRLTVVTRHDVEADRFGLLRDLIVVTPDEAFRRVDRALRVQDRLSSGQLTHQALATLSEGDHRRRRPRTLDIGDHHRFAALPACDDRVGGAQVDAYRSCHDSFLSIGPAGEKADGFVRDLDVGEDFVVTWLCRDMVVRTGNEVKSRWLPCPVMRA
ncbi:NAD-specific glutamate dehydrogenase [Mycobacteroides abscessus subsp. abscessus]|nr:NAD-specific glutamate dehydrogenase [Mycobacteroides abscessus subsp. abscessus]